MPLSAEPAELRWLLNNQVPLLRVLSHRRGSRLPLRRPTRLRLPLALMLHRLRAVMLRPPGAYPPQFPGAKVWGDNTKWAIGLGIAALFCCGPLAGVPGIFLAKKDMDQIAAGLAPNLDESWAKNAYYLNIVAVVLSVLGMCLWWGMGGLRRF